MDEKQIANIDRMEKFYVGHYSSLERLWFEINDSEMGVTVVSDRLKELRNQEAEILTISNEMIRSKPKSLVTKAKAHCDDHFKRVFNAG